MNRQDPARRALADGVDPIQKFSAPKLTRKESVVKRQIDSYRVSEIDDTEVIYLGDQALTIYQSLDLPDATCDGLTFKQRLVATEEGEYLLLARWKPDRYMRRSAPPRSQKWFVEKELFPPDPPRLFARMEKRAEESAQEQD